MKFFAKIIKKNIYLCQNFCMMKSFFSISLIVLIISFFGCGSRGNTNTSETSQEQESSAEVNTSITFVATQIDLGRVWEGNKAVCVFEFQNTGEADLFIHNVRASCGCTTPKYDKKPIKPGQRGEIEVAFDSRGRSGNQRQNVVVTANTEPSTIRLSFTCEVLRPIR